jgi:hypothetical protein
MDMAFALLRAMALRLIVLRQETAGTVGGTVVAASARSARG